MNHDMSRSAIESGPIGLRAGSWEDDEPGDECSACRGDGVLENPATGDEHECWVCDGSGEALA